ncbi:hypothetical protein C8R45DRAFT_1130703 [Mycena sanguinolenta]|nr:hypothetical protein C8R45DRAFT_1130703 [Mycena sanguinolenta]
MSSPCAPCESGNIRVRGIPLIFILAGFYGLGSRDFARLCFTLSSTGVSQPKHPAPPTSHTHLLDGTKQTLNGRAAPATDASSARDLAHVASTVESEEEARAGGGWRQHCPLTRLLGAVSVSWRAASAQWRRASKVIPCLSSRPRIGRQRHSTARRYCEAPHLDISFPATALSAPYSPQLKRRAHCRGGTRAVLFSVSPPTTDAARAHPADSDGALSTLKREEAKDDKTGWREEEGTTRRDEGGKKMHWHVTVSPHRARSAQPPIRGSRWERCCASACRVRVPRPIPVALCIAPAASWRLDLLRASSSPTARITPVPLISLDAFAPPLLIVTWT